MTGVGVAMVTLVYIYIYIYIIIIIIWLHLYLECLFFLIIEFVLRGWPHGQHKSCIPYRGGFSVGDRFEFGSVDQQVRNCGINSG